MMLTREEKETIILWNEADDEVDIFTYNKKLIKILEQAGVKCISENDEGGKRFLITKDWVKIRKPTKRQYSEEERKKKSEHMKRIRHNF